MGNAVAFHYVGPMKLHCENSEQLHAGATFESQMLGLGGIHDTIFSVMGKRAEQCVSKIGDGKVGVNSKYVPYTYKKLLTVEHTSASLTSWLRSKSKPAHIPQLSRSKYWDMSKNDGSVIVWESPTILSLANGFSWLSPRPTEANMPRSIGSCRLTCRNSRSFLGLSRCRC